jgi:hypothetical protein
VIADTAAAILASTAKRRVGDGIIAPVVDALEQKYIKKCQLSNLFLPLGRAESLSARGPTWLGEFGQSDGCFRSWLRC